MPLLYRARLLLALGSLGALALLPASASASVDQAYSCTNSLQTSIVPAGATTAVITVNGAQGGQSASGVTGGLGATRQVQLPVVPGTNLAVQVGCQSGYGGGGSAGHDSYYGTSGTGGGASAVWAGSATVAQAYVVAGGGGGGANEGTSIGGGGSGGNADGNGESGGRGGAGDTGGIGGASGGAAGVGGVGNANNGVAGGIGGAAAGLTGGYGGSGASFTGGAGGGGGGGYTGGGGGGGGAGANSNNPFPPSGATGGGGGGGVSYYDPASVILLGSSLHTGGGDGSVTILYASPAHSSVSPTTESYGTVTTGQSATQTVTVTNTGDEAMNVGTLSLSGPNPGQFQIANDSCSGQVIAGGGTCTVDVKFVPSTDSASSASLQVPSDAPNGTASMALSGTGAYPSRISVSPSPEDFGTVTAGDSQTALFTVYNTGDVAMHIGQASVGGNSDFVLVSNQDFCSGQTVRGGASCTVQVRFTPTSVGATEFAGLSIPSDASGGDGNVSLSGQGANTPAGNVSLSQAFVNYNAVTLGGSESATFSLSNQGSGTQGAVTVGQVSLSGQNPGQFAITTDTCSGQLVADGASCTVTVTFAPSSDGTQGATLQFPTNAADGTATATLMGTGASAANISVTPNPDGFGSVGQGASQTKTFTVANSGDEKLDIGQVSLSGNGDFTIVADQDACSGHAVIGGGTCIVQVQFTPSATGPESTTLTIPSDAGNGTVTVALSATGTAAAIPPQGPTGPAGSTGATGEKGDPGTTGPQGPAATPAPRPPALRLTDVTLSHRVMAPCVGCTPPPLTLSFTLNRAATVTFVLERQTAHGWRRVGSEHRAFAAHRHSVRIGQSFAGQSLTAGTYRVVLTANVGHRKPGPSKVTFTTPRAGTVPVTG